MYLYASQMLRSESRGTSPSSNLTDVDRLPQEAAIGHSIAQYLTPLHMKKITNSNI